MQCITDLSRHADGRRVIRNDQAEGCQIGPGLVEPLQGCAHRLRPIALTGPIGRDHPSCFRQAVDVLADITLEVRKADIADKAPRCPIFNRPIAVTQEFPQTAIA